MKEINLKGLEQEVYQETLENGLDIIFVPYKDKKNYFISYATRYGSEITTFQPAGEKKSRKVPDGIAHFLEHKMFEQEDGIDPFTYFSESGTGSNASTSFDSTQYICYGTKNFKENLKYLLNFVNQPYYTDENVEKEKGIIAEELKMYEDIPEFALEMKLRENIYHVHPRRIDIGGTIPEIMKITKEDLYTCYNNFYSPNNMYLLIVGKFNMKEALKIIKEEVGNIPNRKEAKITKIKEPKTVRKKEEIIHSSVNVPKIGLGVKLLTKDLGEYDSLTLDLYLSMITTILFGSSSIFRENVRNKKLINNFYTEWESIEEYKVLYIMASSENPKVLLEEIKEQFKNVVIEKEALERMKKVWIANEVKMIDDIDSTVHNIYDDFLRYHKVIPNKVEQIRNLNLREINKIASKIDFSNMAVVQLLPQEKAKK